MYSIFAAKERNSFCYAFEPSILNLEILYKNITVNKLNEKINILPIALSDKNKVSKFKLSNLDKGGALSAFDVDYDQFGKKFMSKNFYLSPGMTLDDCTRIFNLKLPDHIKIDVDGIEHLILKGGIKVIQNAESILIETTQEFKESFDICQEILKKITLD